MFKTYLIAVMAFTSTQAIEIEVDNESLLYANLDLDARGGVWELAQTKWSYHEHGELSDEELRQLCYGDCKEEEYSIWDCLHECMSDEVDDDEGSYWY